MAKQSIPIIPKIVDHNQGDVSLIIPVIKKEVTENTMARKPSMLKKNARKLPNTPLTKSGITKPLCLLGTNFLCLCGFLYRLRLYIIIPIIPPLSIVNMDNICVKHLSFYLKSRGIGWTRKINLFWQRHWSY